MGIKGSTTGELVFEDARVPAANLLGEEGDGFKIAMRILTARGPVLRRKDWGWRRERPTTHSSMQRPGRRWASRSASIRSSRRCSRTWRTKCEAARGLLYKFGAAVDEGIEGSELTKLSAMTKLYCTDVAMEVTTDAVQVLGGYGYISEYPLERMMRDAKITQIYEGTNQIQRLVIAREMLKEQRAFLLAGVG